MYFLFLDDSGEDRDPYVTLAGYAMSLPRWAAFEADAKAHLATYGVDHLHTVDLHTRKGQFKGWEREKAHKFAQDLFALAARGKPIGLSFSVRKDRFNEQKRSLGLKREGSPLAFCLKGLLTRMLCYDAIRESLAKPGCALNIVVEDGHKNSGDLLRTFAPMKENDPGRYEGFKLAGKRDYIALQLADFLAYFERRRLTLSNTTRSYLHEMKFYLTVIDQIGWTDRFQAVDFHSKEPTFEEVETGQAFRS